MLLICAHTNWHCPQAYSTNQSAQEGTSASGCTNEPQCDLFLFYLVQMIYYSNPQSSGSEMCHMLTSNAYDILAQLV